MSLAKRKINVTGKSASAKTYIQSFIDPGNDLLKAEDVFEALHSGNGVKDAIECVAETK